MSNLRISKVQKSAFLWGHDTELGQVCLQVLLNHQNYNSIFIIAESHSISSDQLNCVSIIDTTIFEAVSKLGVDDVFLCVHLFGKQSPGANQYSTIDWYYKYPAKIAMLLSLHGANQVALISSAFTFNDVLSNAMRSLEELEKFLYKLTLWSMRIYKPAYINGENSGEEIGAAIISGLMKVLPEFMQNSGPIDRFQFVTYMVDQAQSLQKGRYKLNHRDISKQLNNFVIKSK